MDPTTVQAHRDWWQLLDVREDEEWAASRLDGALHIPLGELPARLEELDRDRLVVTVCRSGGRAGEAAEYLSRTGLTAHVLDGGMQRWAEEGRPFTAADGAPSSVA